MGVIVGRRGVVVDVVVSGRGVKVGRGGVFVSGSGVVVGALVSEFAVVMSAVVSVVVGEGGVVARVIVSRGGVVVCVVVGEGYSSWAGRVSS